jgi:hypothetical protein
MLTKSVLRGALALLVLGLSAASTQAVTLRVYQTRANADVQAGPSGFDSQVQVVPEPSIAGLLACGLAVLGLGVRRRKADRQS